MSQKEKQITVEFTCPNCEQDFESDYEESVLLEDPEVPLSFECDDCDWTWEQAYTYTQQDGVKLGEVVADEDAEEDEDEEDDEDAEEDEDEEDGEKP